MTQSPATLPPGIVDSRNNAFVVQLKMPKDRDLMMAHLALSEKGFVDEHYRRYSSRMEGARSIVKLRYSRDKRVVQPMLAEALSETDIALIWYKCYNGPQTISLISHHTGNQRWIG